MLKRIHIKGYKSLHDVEVELTPLTVLFGPNATGKSNFLEALQLLAKLATSRTLGQAFDPPHRGKPLESFSFGEQGLRELREQDRVSFSIEADLCLSDDTVTKVNQQLCDMQQHSANGSQANAAGKTSAKVRERNLRYRIEVEMQPGQGLLSVADEYLAALTTKGEPAKNRKPFIEHQQDKLCVRMEGQARPTRYDLHLDHSILSKSHYPPHYPHLAAARHELESWLFYYLEPRECMRAPSPAREVQHIGSRGEDLPAYLNTMKAKKPKQFMILEQAIHMFIPEVTEMDVAVDEFGDAVLQLIESDVAMSTRVLSEGTLRMLGLIALAGVTEPPALIGLEEPENSVHPRRIQLIAKLLKTQTNFRPSQYVVVTHSSVLLDLLDRQCIKVVRKSKGHTLIDPLNAWGPLYKWPDISKAPKLDGEERPISKRILRGDFDASD